MKLILLISLFFSNISLSQLTNVSFSAPLDKIGENSSIKTINDSIFIVQHSFDHTLQYWSIYKNNEFLKRKKIPTICSSESNKSTFVDLVITKNKIIGFWKCENIQSTDLYIAYFDSNLELISDSKQYEHYEKKGMHYNYFEEIWSTYFKIKHATENDFISVEFHVDFYHSTPSANNSPMITNYDYLYNTSIYDENLELFSKTKNDALSIDYLFSSKTILKDPTFKDKKITIQNPTLILDSTLFVCGTYTSTNNLFNLGTFWVKYDLKQDKVVELELQKIDLKKIAGSGLIKYIGKDSTNITFDYMNYLFRLDTIISSSDNGFYLVLKSAIYRPSSISYIPNYYVPDFIIQKLDSTGKLTWSNVIYDIATIYNALQTSSAVTRENIDHKFSSVFFVESQNNLNIVFNDNKKNYDHDGIYTNTEYHYKNDNKFKHTCIAMISFDMLTGTKIRKSISTPNTWRLDYMAYMFISQKRKSYFLIVENENKQYAFLRLKFE